MLLDEFQEVRQVEGGLEDEFGSIVVSTEETRYHAVDVKEGQRAEQGAAWSTA